MLGPESLKTCLSRPEKQAFLWPAASKQFPIHENAHFHGQNDLRVPDEQPVSEGSQMVTKKPLRRVADTSSLRKFLFEEIKDIYCTLIVKSGLWILNLSKRS